MMIDAQKDDVKLQERVQLVSNRDKTDYSINDDSGLYNKGRLCVPNVQELKKKLLYERHNTVFTMLVICSSPVAYTLSLYVYIHEAFIILSCYLNCGLT